MKKFLTVLVITLTASAVVFSNTPSALAASVNYNNLMDNQVFDKQTMTVSQVDAFLNSFPNSCISSNSGFRSALPTGYNSSEGFKFGSKVTAGKVIHESARVYGLNPQVLLATLQKEQSLVTGSAGCHATPSPSATVRTSLSCTTGTTTTTLCTNACQYAGGCINIAVGYGCPQYCYASKLGFSKQIIYAAWFLAFTRHRAEGQVNWAVVQGNWDNSDDLSTNYPGPMARGTHQRCSSCSSTYYSGAHTLGDGSVTIQNGATAALYYYTPFKSGNTNFVNIFSSWFGSTHAVYERLDMPRWMVTSTATYKKDPASGENTDQSFPQGTQMYFVDKIKVDGVWYLRTLADSQAVRNQGVPLIDVTEISYQNLSDPRYLQLTTDVYKMNPRTGQPDRSYVFKQGTTIKIKDKIYVNGSWYFRSEYDVYRGWDITIDAANLTEVPYTSLVTPRFLEITRNTTKLNPVTEEVDSAVIYEGTQIRFGSKIFVGGHWYYRTAVDTAGSTALAIPASNIQDVPYQPVTPTPKWMRLKNDSTKAIPRTNTTTSETLSTGTQLRIAGTITVNGTVYYRTASDTSHDLDKGIAASSFEEIPYASVDTPEWLQTRSSITKLNPRHGFRASTAIQKGTQLQITQQITINGVLYYRTAYDVANSVDMVVRASDLKNIPYVALEKPRWMALTETTTKYVPKTGQAVGDPLVQGSGLYFTSKVNINGQWYLRTKSDTQANRDQAIPLTALNEL